jgi:hypothetical protein
MFLSAWHLRQSKHAGEKWYEIVISTDEVTGTDKVIDARAFAPLTTYLFFAEMFQHPENLEIADYAQASIGLNRMAGSGLVLFDLLRKGTSKENSKKIMQSFAGQYMSSFTVPARQFKDFADAIPPEDTMFRDSRRDNIVAPFLEKLPIIAQLTSERFTGPTIGNIPFLSKKLEEVPVTTTARIDKQLRILGIPASVFKQISGFTIKEKNVLEKEIDRLNIPRFTFFPRTGVPAADVKIAKLMMPDVFNIMPKVIRSEEYKTMSEPGQRKLLKTLFSQIKQDAIKRLARTDYELSNRIQVEKMTKAEQEQFQEIVDESQTIPPRVLETAGFRTQD